MKIIHITGSGKFINLTNYHGYERYKDFHCYGDNNPDKVCSYCIVRYLCFTEQEQVELSYLDFNKNSITEITADMVAQYIVPDIDYKVVTDNNKKKVVFDFKGEKDDNL